MSDFSEVKKMGVWLPISNELLMDYGVIADTRPPVVITRRMQWRWWRDEHLTVRALRYRLADWIDPDGPREDSR